MIIIIPACLYFFYEKRFVEIQLINQKKDWVTNMKDWQAVHLLRRVEDRPCCCESTSTAPSRS